MALNTWHVALGDPNDPASDRVLVMTEDEVRDTYPQFAGRPTQFVDRDGIFVRVTVTNLAERIVANRARQTARVVNDTDRQRMLERAGFVLSDVHDEPSETQS